MDRAMPKKFLCCTTFMAFLMASPAFSQDQNVVALKIDASISCEDAKNFVNMPLDHPDYDAHRMRHDQCVTEEYNARREEEGGSERKVAVARYNEDERRFFYDILTIQDIENINSVCNDVMSAGGFGSDVPIYGAVGDSVAQYTCASYVQAALKDDPLLILAPTMIPGNQITRDLLRFTDVNLKKLGIDAGSIPDAIENTVDQTMDDDLDVEDTIAPTVTAPLKLGKDLVDSILD